MLDKPDFTCRFEFEYLYIESRKAGLVRTQPVVGRGGVHEFTQGHSKQGHIKEESKMIGWEDGS